MTHQATRGARGAMVRGGPGHPGLVVAAMSGGVDSSVAAALLVEQGYQVVGVTLRLGQPGDALCSPEDPDAFPAAADARRVAARLGIPHHVVDLRDAFDRCVRAPFEAEYARGRTPNPCVRCNPLIKFGALLQWARRQGADRVATGHYARARLDPASGRFLLLRGADRRKDQSYVLYGLSQEQLAAALFPLGELTKEETRHRARTLGLEVAEKADSQEVCFAPGGRYGRALSAPAATTPGPIVDRTGRLVGEHPGIGFFTLGQKKGLKLRLPYPLFVVEILPESNTLVVGPEEELTRRACVVGSLNWIAVPALSEPLPVTARVRHGMEDVPAVLYPLEDGAVRLEFERPQRAITPGQAAVFYRGDVVVGGGTIDRVLPEPS